MNGYVAFWNSKRIEVEAKTAYEAQQIAAVKFGKRCKRWDVAVVLAQAVINGEYLDSLEFVGAVHDCLIYASRPIQSAGNKLRTASN